MATQENDLRSQLQVMLPEDLITWINIVMFGDPGSGKTLFCGTAADHPETRPVLHLDIEGGARTIRDKIRDDSNLDVIRVKTVNQLVDIQNKLYRSIDPNTGFMYYKTVTLDNLAELAALDMKDIMNEAYNRKPDTTDKDVPSPREWGKTRNHMRDIVRAFRDLPCNTIFTCHVRTKEEEGQPTQYRPNFAGQLNTDIPGLVDMVGYYYVDMKGGVPTRKLQFAQTRRVIAKDRTGLFGAEVINPTIPMLWEMINPKEGTDNGISA